MYAARITRNNPTAFIFLIDQSGSMTEDMKYGDLRRTKSEVVAIVTNMLIRELLNRCRREEGLLDYLQVAAIGYSAGGINNILSDTDDFVTPTQLEAMECEVRELTYRKMIDGDKMITMNDNLKFWITPRAEGNTPMRAALDKAYYMLSKWCGRKENKASYPPTIFNITDGEASDGDYSTLLEISEDIKSLSTDDGNPLLININLSSNKEKGKILFPTSIDELPESKYSKLLFEMSSIMPQPYNEAIMKLKGTSAQPPFRGMSLNTSVSDMIAMMNIGSRSVNKM